MGMRETARIFVHGGSQAVRDFGQRMVADHSKANDELKQIVSTKGAMLPSQITHKENAAIDRLEKLSAKLVNRHPHVFGDVKAETPSDVLRNWEALKAEEKKKRLAAGGGKSAR